MAGSRNLLLLNNSRTLSLIRYGGKLSPPICQPGQMNQTHVGHSCPSWFSYTNGGTAVRVFASGDSSQRGHGASAARKGISVRSWSACWAAAYFMHVKDSTPQQANTQVSSSWQRCCLSHHPSKMEATNLHFYFSHLNHILKEFPNHTPIYIFLRLNKLYTYSVHTPSSLKAPGREQTHEDVCSLSN